jgi:hypothetical protein
MNFDGYTPNPIEKWTSLVEQDDATNLPIGCGVVVRNTKFHLASARTRDGLQNQYGFQLPDKAAVTGLAAQKIGVAGQSDMGVPLAFSSLGHLYIESPAGSSKTKLITGPIVTLPQNSSAQIAQAFKNGYLAFTDLQNSTALPAVYNPTLGTLDPLSMKPVGVAWLPGVPYYVGEVVTPNPYINGVASGYPVGGNGHTYRCIRAGLSGAAQPVFPTGEGATIDEGGAAPKWQENTIVLAQSIPVPVLPTVNRSAGAGTFAAGRDVYIAVTLVNPQGETTPSPYFLYQSTVLNDRFVVTSPTIANWVAALPATYKPTGYNVYEADVAHGGAIPAFSSFKLVTGVPIPLGVAVNVDTSGVGAAPPAATSALIVPVGNICFGLRYMVVMFMNRNGYISGWTASAVASYNGATNGFQLYGAYIPVGPPGTIARVCAFTPAGQLSQLAGTGISNAGPYFFIEPSFQNGVFNLAAQPSGVRVAETVSGVQELTTLINDNVTTTATFNFDDDYLKSTTNDVSSYSRKIQVPGCADIYYAPSIRRLFYAADNLKSGWYVSLPGDPESIYGDTNGILQCAENDGTNRVTVREYATIVYLLKDKSGHVLTPSPDDPGKWDVSKAWDGSGPCGPRAVDVGTSFMCYVHRSGVWIFMSGKPFRISKEIPITWSKINWAYAKTIWVCIDDETQEIRIGVPYGKSTVPNKVLTCNFEQSPAFEPPLIFSRYAGKEIALTDAYKWSVDDISANLAIRAERPLTMALPDGFDTATAQSQLLFASSNHDGEVSPVIPFMFNDNGGGIDWVYETAAAQSLMRPSQLGGVQANVGGGGGQLQVSVLGLRAKAAKDGGPPVKGGVPAANAGAEIVLKKPLIPNVPYSCGGSMTNERLRLRFTNRKQPDVWGDLQWAAIYARPITSARPG